jgi:hypothetical protein
MIMPGLPSRKWEFWADNRRRSRTICVVLEGSALTIANRQVSSDGRMSSINSLPLDVAHLPKLIRILTRALGVARSRQQIEQ